MGEERKEEPKHEAYKAEHHEGEIHRVVTLDSFNQDQPLDADGRFRWRMYKSSGLFFLRLIVLKHFGCSLPERDAIEKAEVAFDWHRAKLEEACDALGVQHPNFDKMSFQGWVLGD